LLIQKWREIMRKMTLLAAAAFLTLAAVSGAKPLSSNLGTAVNAAHIPPLPTCWVLVCDEEGVCMAVHTYCPS
jgi:hypothetical protein